MTCWRDLLLALGDPLDLELQVEGTWPDGLHGTAYWVMPDIRGPGPGILFAPGVLARVQLDGTGRTVRWASTTVRTPDARLRERTPGLFRRMWIAEMSPYGFSNAANTNPLAFKGRLLLTWDGGRPVEVNAETGDFITVLGERARWQEGTKYPLLPAIATTAHPVYDHERDLIYGVDHCAALSTRAPASLRVMTWDTQTGPMFHRVDNSRLRQSVHAVGQTQNHLVLAQGALRLEARQAIDGSRARPQRPETPLWIIRKSDLRAGVANVRATQIVIKRELNHLFCDWEDTGGRITMFAQHTSGLDLNCWLKPGDFSELTGEPVPESLIGMYAGATDVSLLGRYELDLKAAEVSEARLQGDPSRHWTSNLYTKSEAPADLQRHTHLFNLYSGHYPELITEEVFRLYARHPYRTVPAVDVPLLTVPGCLDVFDLTSMTRVGGYQFKPGEVYASPLAVPKLGKPRQNQMWVLALRLDGPQTRLCVFDGEALARGPIAVATHADFKIALPLHCTWIPEPRERDSEYRVPFSADVGPGYQRLSTEAKRAAEAVMRELG